MVANWWVLEKQELRSGQDAGDVNAMAKQISAISCKRSALAHEPQASNSPETRVVCETRERRRHWRQPPLVRGPNAMSAALYSFPVKNIVTVATLALRIQNAGTRFRFKFEFTCQQQCCSIDCCTDFLLHF
jgi:hypothetical protein